MASIDNSPGKLSIVADSDEALAHKLEELNRNLSSDTKAVNFAMAPVHLSRKASTSSLVSSASDESRYTPNLNGSTLSTGSDKKHTRWPSFTNAFPSFLNSGAGSAPLSTMSLWQQWDSVINNWDLYSKKKSQVSELIKRGIPDEFRPLVWQLYTGAHDSPLKNAYHKYLKETSPFERAIRRDVSRTYPKHDFFKEKGAGGQTSLYNVMKAYSLHDREVGYCQGSGFIVGLLLMQMNEVDAFAVLVQLMNEYRLRELYKPCMSELGVRMHQLDSLLAEHLPDLYTHFVAQAFAPSLYASAWFLTLFATAFTLPMATRVMDLFIAEGMDFILRLSLAILTQFAPRLIQMDMESMIFFLQQTESTEWEDHGRILFETATALKLNQRKLKKLRNEYLTVRSQERGEQIELRRLRTENGLLMQRLARMEEDNNYLASQLVDCNLQRAQLAEEVIRLRGSVASMYARESTATLASASEPSTVSALTASASTAPASSSALPDKVPSITGVNGVSATSPDSNASELGDMC
uniref:Rab-GAP TBC domain-containing protein n=1 Tax=Schistocephalus solidus TaxID=70667 RepID=A0A0X3PTB9_SCHSO